LKHYIKGKKPDPKDHVYEMSRRVNYMETDSRLAVAMGLGGSWGGVLLSGYEVSFWGDEKVLE